jgi:oxygen-independent coproporphyrinogen-3 oxidase
MHDRLLVYAEREAPRYTSYPTAPHFNAGIGGAQVRAWFAAIPADVKLSLYVHVPYCRQLCWYCGCNTYAARRDEPLMDFADAMLEEIDLVSGSLRARAVSEIHWGGGTPNILTPEQFKRIADRIALRFDTGGVAQHAIELDPRYVDEEKARAYAQAGVNRVSLGVQDLNPRIQEAIGRVQPFEVVERTVETLRGAGIGRINMDLMYGLPHQNLEHLRDSIRFTAALRPDRFALFGYAHVPWFKKRQRLIPEAALPGPTERLEQAQAARAELEALGYVAVGIDHFALPSDELAMAVQERRLRRSFQGYVIEQAGALIGFGPSAISTLPQGYAQNAAEPGAWARSIHDGELAVARGHALSTGDRLRRRLIEQIMCDFEGDLAPLGGAEACANELAELAPMFADGMIELSHDRLILSAAARPFCRLVGLAFDLYAQRGVARHSRAV